VGGKLLVLQPSPGRLRANREVCAALGRDKEQPWLQAQTHTKRLKRHLAQREHPWRMLSLWWMAWTRRRHAIKRNRCDSSDASPDSS
jgi:hypothetical protein